MTWLKYIICVYHWMYILNRIHPCHFVLWNQPFSTLKFVSFGKSPTVNLILATRTPAFWKYPHHTMITHTINSYAFPSFQVETRQSQSYKFKRFRKAPKRANDTPTFALWSSRNAFLPPMHRRYEMTFNSYGGQQYGFTRIDEVSLGKWRHVEIYHS